MSTTAFEYELNTAVKALPELYQPLYGQDNYRDRSPARNCEDRLKSLVETISAQVARPLKVLDIGCAQGYFTLGLADQILGVSTLGIDYLQENISVCTLLAKNLNVQASFACEPITKQNFIKLLDNNYQVILFLNVLHHICTQRGWPETREMLDAAATSSDFTLIELSSSRENLNWVENQPQDNEWLESFNFVRKIGEFSTHVSTEKRSLYFCSNKYVFVAGKLFSYTTYMDKSHPLAIGAQELGRHYYLSTSIVAKKFLFAGQHKKTNCVELAREIKYLKATPSPQLLASEMNGEEGMLVREKIAGALLSEMWTVDTLEATKALYLKLLVVLSALQRRSVYHHDLRPWNIILTTNETIELIDFGAITSKKRRKCFEDAVFLLHWLTKKEWRDNTDPTILLDSNCPWQAATIAYLQTTSTSDLSFEHMLDIAKSETNISLADTESLHMVQLHTDALNSNLRRLALLARSNTDLRKSVESAASYIKSLLNELHTVQSVIEAERNAWAIERSETKKHVDALTEWATNADAYGKSLLETLNTERHEARKQIDALTEWATSADAYSKSLAEELNKRTQ